MSAHHFARMGKSVDEVDFSLERYQRSKRRAQFHRVAVAFGPPFRRMNSVAEEQKREPFWWGSVDRFAVDGKQPGRFQPRQGDRSAKALQNDASRNLRPHG